jgi:hypothetical protein
VKITDALRGEHGVLYAQFDQLERDLDEVAPAVNVYWRAADGMRGVPSTIARR